MKTENEATMSATRLPVWKRILLPELLRGKSNAQVIAYVGVMTALLIGVNFFEFKFADVQFSFTVFASILAGILIGPLLGAVAVFLGDGIGFLLNSAGLLYMPWVGLSVSAMAAVAGLLMKLPLSFRGSGYCKLLLICLFTLLFCSVGINTTGMYLYYTRVGFTARSLGLLAEHFGGVNTYLTYALIRLVFMGQLWNSLFNYAMLFVAVPLLNAARPLRLHIA